MALAAFIVNIFPKNFEIEVFYVVNLLSSIFTTIGVYKLIKILFKREIGYLTALMFLSYSVFRALLLNNNQIWGIPIQYTNFRKIST